MKYKNMNVIGYRRSGTHYVTAVLSKNFFNEDEYLKYYQKHKIPNQFNFKNDTAYICVKRNFEDIAKSIFKMRKRFGLKKDNFDKFLMTPYNKMWNSNVGKFSVKVETLTNQKIVSKVGGGLKSINLIPRKHWGQYYISWMKIENARNNVKIVNYEDFVEDFDGTMSKMADFFGSDKKEFINIEKKVGWTPL